MNELLPLLAALKLITGGPPDHQRLVSTSTGEHTGRMKGKGTQTTDSWEGSSCPGSSQGFSKTSRFIVQVWNPSRWWEQPSKTPFWTKRWLLAVGVRHNISCRRREFWDYMSCYGMYVGGTKGDTSEGSTWFVEGSIVGKWRDREIKRFGHMEIGSF